jgi:lipoprotein-anchoring transpeptidase ErfK/SrfK
MEVTAVATNPTYSYDPEKNFQQGQNKEKLTLPPGPNGPVGSVWIDLSKPTFGIHGTPEPSKVSKSSSHGCIRLTNWDAQELAKMVVKGTPVEIVD